MLVKGVAAALMGLVTLSWHAGEDHSHTHHCQEATPHCLLLISFPPMLTLPSPSTPTRYLLTRCHYYHLNATIVGGNYIMFTKYIVLFKLVMLQMSILPIQNYIHCLPLTPPQNHHLVATTEFLHTDSTAIMYILPLKVPSPPLSLTPLERHHSHYKH